MENILLVFGGCSYEHDISIITASQIYNKTHFEDKKLIPFYIAKDNKFYIYTANKFKISDFSDKKNLKNRKLFKEVTLIQNENNTIFVKSRLGLKEYLKAYIAIIACHGSTGENGSVEAIFESVNIYSSAGNVDSLAVCMNKYLFKNLMYGIKVPVVSGFKVTYQDFDKNKDYVISKVTKLGFPLVIKPNNGGSSIGLFIANNLEEFNEKILEAFEFDNEILIEKFIKGTREFNIAVLGDYDDYLISEIDEPLKNNEVLTFSDKYLSNQGSKTSKIDKSLKNSMAESYRKFPANIDDGLKKRIIKLTEKIFKCLNLRGVVRIDYLFDEESNKIYVCEVNSIPGSLSYYFYCKNNLIINDFVLKLINIAKKYKNNKFVVNKEYFTDILK